MYKPKPYRQSILTRPDSQYYSDSFNDKKDLRHLKSVNPLRYGMSAAPLPNKASRSDQKTNHNIFGGGLFNSYE